jgi:hypothetical protein
MPLGRGNTLPVDKLASSQRYQLTCGKAGYSSEGHLSYGKLASGHTLPVDKLTSSQEHCTVPKAGQL